MPFSARTQRCYLCVECTLPFTGLDQWQEVLHHPDFSGRSGHRRLILEGELFSVMMGAHVVNGSGHFITVFLRLPAINRDTPQFELVAALCFHPPGVEHVLAVG